MHGHQRLLLKCAALTLAAGFLLLGGQARAFGDQDAGHRLAAAWCSGCHQVEPQRQTSVSDAIPSFQAVAAMPSTTSTSIRAFLSTTHQEMPDLKLTDEQIDDFGAYILSLRGRQAM